VETRLQQGPVLLLARSRIGDAHTQTHTHTHIHTNKQISRKENDATVLERCVINQKPSSLWGAF